jgi:hypothetical protein
MVEKPAAKVLTSAKKPGKRRPRTPGMDNLLQTRPRESRNLHTSRRHTDWQEAPQCRMESKDCSDTKARLVRAFCPAGMEGTPAVPGARQVSEVWRWPRTLKGWGIRLMRRERIRRERHGAGHNSMEWRVHLQCREHRRCRKRGAGPRPKKHTTAPPSCHLRSIEDGGYATPQQ